MKLREYLDGMRAAQTADELNAAIIAPYPDPFIGPVSSRIRNVRLEAGRRICDAHPLGHFVPRFGPKRLLQVCGESRHIYKGGNSTGVRYAWHDANEWAKGVLRENGLSDETANQVMNCWSRSPHRALRYLEAAHAAETSGSE